MRLSKPYHTTSSHHNGFHEPGEGCEACCDCWLCTLRYWVFKLHRWSAS